MLEARDQGTPSRAARVSLKVTVLDVNDNSPEIVDPQGDVVSVREEQSPGTEVARVRALDTDLGENASVTYSITKGKSYTIEFNIVLIYLEDVSSSRSGIYFVLDCPFVAVCDQLITRRSFN